MLVLVLWADITFIITATKDKSTTANTTIMYWLIQILLVAMCYYH